MNGKASKRIRFAAACSHRDVAQLKKEYRALPYHRRRKPGIVIESHSAVLRRKHAAEVTA